MEQLLFLHIAKTAGTSLSLALTQIFPPAEVFHIRKNAHPSAPVFSPQHGDLKSFLALPLDERGRFRLILGHFKFGLHEALPGRSRYVTVLRDPVERVISNFGQFNRVRVFSRTRLGTFQEFCRERPGFVSNFQTRSLCGRDFDERRPEASLELACSNLRQWFVAVGTQEEYEELLQILEMTFGWPELPYSRENPGTHRPREIDSATREWLEEHNALDRELYRFSGRLMAETIDLLGRDDFEHKLAVRRQRRRAWPRVMRRALDRAVQVARERIFLGLRMRGYHLRIPVLELSSRDAMTRAPRVGLYARRFPKAQEAWAVNKFVGLLDAGVDVRVFARKQGQDWDRFRVFAERPALRRSVLAMPSLDAPRWSIRVHAEVVARFARAISAHPRHFARFVAHNWRWRRRNGLGFWRGLYERLPFVGQELDILHVELDTQAPGVADMKEYLGCRLVLSGRSTLQRTGKPAEWPGGYSLLFGMADAYHVETDSVSRNLRGLGLDDSVPIRRISSFVDAHGAFTPVGERKPPPHEPLRILTVSRLAIEKGLEFALEAVALARDAGVALRYTIVGAGPHEPAIRFAAHQLGLLAADVVRFSGSVPFDRLPDCYRQADVLLHASTDEGMPYVPLEAQAMELPVVITDACGSPEAVADGIAGFVVPCRDARALADRLIQLARHPERRLEMGRAGRARVLEHFDIRERMREYLRFYSDLMANPPRSAAVDSGRSAARSGRLSPP